MTTILVHHFIFLFPLMVLPPPPPPLHNPHLSHPHRLTQSLGRRHSVEDGLRCLQTAKSLFPSRVSADFLFARPKATTTTTSSVGKLKEELREIMRLADDHVSIYQLTVERATPLHQVTVPME